MIVALFYFMIPLLFEKMSVYFIRWLKGWRIERLLKHHFYFETLVGKYLFKKLTVIHNLP